VKYFSNHWIRIGRVKISNFPEKTVYWFTPIDREDAYEKDLSEDRTLNVVVFLICMYVVITVIPLAFFIWLNSGYDKIRKKYKE
jgi:hypothetical protein